MVEKNNNILNEVDEYLSTITIGKEITTSTFKKELSRINNRPEGSYIPTDYCYNSYCINSQWDTSKVFYFERMNSKGSFKYLGKNYPYTGYVYDKNDNIYGYWDNGVFTKQEEVNMTNDKFTWVPFFEELLDIICKNYNAKTLYLEFKKLIPEDQYNDIDQIDPLTFIGCICAGNKVAITRANIVKKIFRVQAKEISDITGIPNFVHGAYKYFHEQYQKGADANKVMQTLWDFANQINDNKINEETFNTIVNFQEVKIGKLSQIIYICKPHVFYSCDRTMLSYLYRQSEYIENNYNSFLEIQNFCQTFDMTPYELSTKAWDYSCQRKMFFNYIKRINKPSYNNFINNQILGEKFEKKIYQMSNRRLFDIKTCNEIDILLDELKNNDEWIKYNSNNQNGIPKAILNTHYKNFINSSEIPNGTEQMNTKSDQPLNQILYGPPGTGKTYNTVVEALKITDNDFYDKHKDNYEKLQERFNELKQLGQIEFVTFHQSYSYEEFVEGIKPDLNSEDKLTYELKDGIFKKICSNAQTTIKIEKNFDQIYDQFIKDLNSSKKLLILTTPNGSEFGIKTNKKNNLKIYTGENFDRNSVGVITKDYLQNEIFKNGRKCYVQGILDYLNEHYKLNIQTTKNSNKYILIIDEINRGNISKIFGELITLIEEDKRESLSLKLPYSQDPFTVPKNLYIIGTMNTSDRSIASIDIALRRRFTFKEMMPDSTLIDEELEVHGLNIQDIFKTLNERISVLLDRDHQIGHSYFMNLKADKDLETNFKQIWFDCIIPLLNEYFYGDWDKLQALLGKAQDNGESFIKKLSQVKFATDYTCDEDETFDFTPQKDIDFSKALKNAFETKKHEQEEK